MSAAYRSALSAPSPASIQDQTVVLTHPSASSPKQWTRLAPPPPPIIAPGSVTLLDHGAEAAWAIARALTEGIAQARRRTIRGAGDISPISHPDAANPLIVALLERSATR